MESQEIKPGSIVRHRHIMMGTDLFVLKVESDTLLVRYAVNHTFQTQELLMMEVELYEVDEDEYL